MAESVLLRMLMSELGGGSGRSRSNDGLLKTDYHRKLYGLVEKKNIEELHDAFQDLQPVQQGYEESIRETCAWGVLLRKAFNEAWFFGAKSLIKAVPQNVLQEDVIACALVMLSRDSSFDDAAFLEEHADKLTETIQSFTPTLEGQALLLRDLNSRVWVPYLVEIGFLKDRPEIPIIVLAAHGDVDQKIFSPLFKSRRDWPLLAINLALAFCVRLGQNEKVDVIKHLWETNAEHAQTPIWEALIRGSYKHLPYLIKERHDVKNISLDARVNIKNFLQRQESHPAGIPSKILTLFSRVHYAAYVWAAVLQGDDGVFDSFQGCRALVSASEKQAD